MDDQLITERDVTKDHMIHAKEEPKVVLRDVIHQAMTHLGGERSVKEVRAYIEERHPGRWSDISTAMADLTHLGNRSSNYPKRQRFLTRVRTGVYKFYEAPAPS